MPFIIVFLLLAGPFAPVTHAEVAKVAAEPARTNGFALLVPGPDDPPIARFTARALQQFQYRHQVFNDVVSSNFLVRFMNDLDPQRIHFLQSDEAEFARYRTTLDDLTLRYGDTRPAYEIFQRFRERLAQRTAYAEQLLRTEKFEFTADERVTVNRRNLPYPADLAIAEKLWRERVRFEYLQERLGAINPVGKTNATAKATPVKPPAQIHSNIVQTISRRYDRILKIFKDWDSDDVFQYYLTTLAHVYDPHSDYFGKAQFEEFSLSMNLSLFGIGAVLRSEEDGYCKIAELKPGPALKGGQLKVNDRIVAVAQGTNEPMDVVDLPLIKVVQQIRGPKGSEVRLTVIPADATDLSLRKVVSIIREEIKIEDSAAKAKVGELPNGKGGPLRLGVIDLPAFYATMDVQSLKDKATPRSTTADVTKLLVKLAEEKVAGVILDLRRNGGGSLEEAINLTGLFIPRGPVVQVRTPAGEVLVREDEDPGQLYNGPLIVLTSRHSASASEILAGALQDYGRAIIVGDTTTHGKGTVQQVVQFAPYLRNNLATTNDPGALKVTISKFYRPSGASTQLKGVAADIVLPSVNNVAEIGESETVNPLPWDSIAGSDYQLMNCVAPYLEELRQRSALRVAKSKDFAYIREDMELFQKAQADKTVSLNEKQRIKETKEAEARRKAREAEITARPASARKVYEISLQQAAIPGLPAPVTQTNASAGSASSEPSDEPVVGSAPPAVDAHLEEAEHILADYISLAAAGEVTAVKR